jgi:hypothetical protein
VESNTREPHISKDVLRGLRSISITDPTLTSGDWSPLTDLLARRAAIGNRIPFLHLDCYPHMSEDVFESIRQAVDVFEEWESYEESDDDY